MTNISGMRESVIAFGRFIRNPPLTVAGGGNATTQTSGVPQ